jgi:hypothetical protein
VRAVPQSHEVQPHVAPHVQRVASAPSRLPQEQEVQEQLLARQEEQAQAFLVWVDMGNLTGRDGGARCRPGWAVADTIRCGLVIARERVPPSSLRSIERSG